MELWDGWSFGEKPNGLKTKDIVQYRIYKNSRGLFLKVLEVREAFNQLHHYVTTTDSIAHATRFDVNHELKEADYSNIGIKATLNSFTPSTIQITTEIDIVVIE